jgi:hypothetical protein
MIQPWKRVERRGTCHYSDVSSEPIHIVSVDDYDSIPRAWRESAGQFQGMPCFLVIFDRLSPYTFECMSGPPLATLEAAVRYAEDKIPTGIVWEDSENVA